jgi:hypothetical protein
MRVQRLCIAPDMRARPAAPMPPIGFASMTPERAADGLPLGGGQGGGLEARHLHPPGFLLGRLELRFGLLGRSGFLSGRRFLGLPHSTLSPRIGSPTLARLWLGDGIARRAALKQ